MENLATCPHCEREHRVGNGWAFCPGHPQAHGNPGDNILQVSQSCAGLCSVQEREEAFWRHILGPWRESLKHISIAVQLVLPTVLARLLDARADPNFRDLPHSCSVFAPHVNFMETPSQEVILSPRNFMQTPLHEVLKRLRFRQWFGRGAMSAIANAVPDCVKLLVQYKADLSLVDAWDRTPVQVAFQHRREGVHFASGLTREVLKLTEQCIEIMAPAARATMPSREAEAATDLRLLWCMYCMRSLRSLEHRNLDEDSCAACYWKGYGVWCAQCDAWRPLVADFEAATTACPTCQVLLQPSRYFCQSCYLRHADCDCPKEDGQAPALPKSSQAECKHATPCSSSASAADQMSDVNLVPAVQGAAENSVSPKRVCRGQQVAASPRADNAMKRLCSKCDEKYFKGAWSDPQETEKQ